MPDPSRELLHTLREKVKGDQRNVLTAILDLSGRANGDPKIEGELEFGLERYQTLTQRLGSLPEVAVVHEPDIYQRTGPHSFFADLVASVAPFPVPGTDPAAARERLGRHQQHEQPRLEIEGRLARTGAAYYGIQPGDPGAQLRALSSIVPGAGGPFVPPKWLTEDFASVVRAACPLRKLLRTIPLPPDTMELHIPRVNVSGGVLVDSSGENVNPPSTASVTDAIVAPVVTFSGEIAVSQQLWERGSFDAIAVPDFGES
jgi:hypothetical protein